MKNKLGPMLFALPFLGIGAWAAWSIGSNAFDAWQMRGWTPVEATLVRAGLATRSGDDADTYEAYADYRYYYGEREYFNDRVAIAGGSDNVGSFQQDTGKRLQAAMARGEKVTAYVDPQHPAESILDRSMRWGLYGFKAIFLFVFGGVGLGMLVYLFRAPDKKDAAASQFKDQPWLQNGEWQTATVRSAAKKSTYFAWGFAVLWNLISAPLPFLIYEEIIEKNNRLALIGLLFPLVGMGLLSWAVRQTLEWRRFGPAPVTLDPFPGSVGGHVGGNIDVNLPYTPNATFRLTLTSLYSYVSGSGKNRSRRESAKWQDALVAHATPGPKGTRLSFRFDVPPDLNESDAVQGGDDYHLWRLSLQADLPGMDINRDYEIPVYATAARSEHLEEYSMQQARAEQRRLDESALRQHVQLSFDQGGRRLYFPMGRTLAAGLGGFAVGALFSGAGWFLALSADQVLMGCVFGFVGSVILLSGLYFLFNSLEVRLVGDSIESVRRILGLPVRRRSMRRADFREFSKQSSMQSQSGGRHVMYYAVFAIDQRGNKLPVGDGFKGAGQADAAAKLIGREFGLGTRDVSLTDFANDALDPLGPDQASTT
jgi:hypothetical protein